MKTFGHIATEECEELEELFKPFFDKLRRMDEDVLMYNIGWNFGISMPSAYTRVLEIACKAELEFRGTPYSDEAFEAVQKKHKTED